MIKLGTASVAALNQFRRQLPVSRTIDYLHSFLDPLAFGTALSRLHSRREVVCFSGPLHAFVRVARPPWLKSKSPANIRRYDKNKLTPADPYDLPKRSRCSAVLQRTQAHPRR
jgi:hypothetical protein